MRAGDRAIRGVDASIKACDGAPTCIASLDGQGSTLAPPGSGKRRAATTVWGPAHLTPAHLRHNAVWRNTPDTSCPECRQPVKSARRNHTLKAVVAAYLEKNPGSRRPAEELQELDQKSFFANDEVSWHEAAARVKLLPAGRRPAGGDRYTCPHVGPS